MFSLFTFTFLKIVSLRLVPVCESTLIFHSFSALLISVSSAPLSSLVFCYRVIYVSGVYLLVFLYGTGSWRLSSFFRLQI